MIHGSSICSVLYLEDGTRVGGTTGPELGALLGDGSGNGRSLHLSLVVDDDAGGVLEVDEDALLSAEGLALADDDAGHDLLTELGLALLDGAHDHVAGGGLGEAVQPGADVADGDDVHVLGAGVVGAVDDGGGGETGRNLVLDAVGGGTSTSNLLTHFELFVKFTYGKNTCCCHDWRRGDVKQRCEKNMHIQGKWQRRISITQSFQL